MQRIKPQELAIRRRMRDDFEFYAPRCLTIRTKSGEKKPFRLNSAQRYLHQRLEDQRQRKGMIRALQLKGRQQGVSTYAEGRFYWRVTHSKGVRAFILTHEQEATHNLFSMVQRYHDNCPAPLRPSVRASNAKELSFDKLDSEYKLGTAGTKGVGRSSTIQLFHGSEVAFWPHADTHLAGVLQAVPNEPGTEVLLESTANGVGGVFYDLWQEAVSGKGRYEAIFLPWFWQTEYRTKPDAEFQRTEEEQELARLYQLDDAQLTWRRDKIHELKSLDLFKQEYPCTPEEAFIFSGRQAFEQVWLDAAEGECFLPKYRADVDFAAERLIKRAAGALRVWDEPAPGRRYVIGADVAEGLETGDFSCADVLDSVTGYQVAQWHGHCDPDHFGRILALLGKHYNRALIGVERNNHGLVTLTTLRNSGYPNLYAQQDIERRSEGVETRKLGWLTTSKSKFKIIDQLAAELRDKTHGIACKETISEMRTYVIEENGSYNSKPGCHDDRVMARAIAGEVLMSQPRSWRVAA
ncbi:MAG: hypothetical protein HQL47_06140 [Gammaproteobacteria bacterium]|nr:hypothetical protein [Gammaproteobacteria bacterium]